MGISFLPLIVVAMVPIITGNFGLSSGYVFEERDARGNDDVNPDYLDYSAEYDDFAARKTKRAAVLFDQLMVALQKMVEQNQKGAVRSKDRSRSHHSPRYPSATNPEIVPEDDRMLDMQRRGQFKGNKDDLYWRCYFNAVTCFKRKR